jgi:biopolymer transport protein ExbB
MMTETYEFIERGGPVMYFIILCSIGGTAVFIERMWSLRRIHIVPADFAGRLVSLLDDRRWAEALAACHENGSSLARVAAAGIRQRERPADKIEAAMETAGKGESARMEKYIGWLGLLATVAPLLGLLGTVTGMIKMFQQVSARGIGDHKFVAMGIWEALIATASGLIVAIPCFVAYRFLTAKVDNLTAVLEEAARTVSEKLDAGPERPPETGEKP